jgi:hypothetical protein
LRRALTKARDPIRNIKQRDLKAGSSGVGACLASVKP